MYTYIETFPKEFITKCTCTRVLNEKKRYDTKTRLTQQCKRNLTLNWRIHASFTQRVLHVCIAIQRDAHRTRYTQWAVECTVHAEESQICKKYAVYPRRRIVRNITADSSVLHAAERDNIPIFFQQLKRNTRETLRDRNVPCSRTSK